MKIRNGLVSNSSSSSFTMIVKSKPFVAALEKVHPFVKACAEEFFEEDTCFEAPVMVAQYVSNAGGYSNWDNPLLEDYDEEIPLDKYGDQMRPQEAIEEDFRNVLKKEEYVIYETFC